MSELSTTKAVGKSAQISQCGRYRYSLQRWWVPIEQSYTDPTAYWVMLNPSTADADIDDPTIRRCIGFSKRWGFGSLKVVNLFPYRATKPSDMQDAAEAGINIFGEQGDWYLDNVLTECDPNLGDEVIAAWGASLPSVGVAQAERFIAEAEYVPCRLSCLGTTKAGHPRHPLYVKGSTPLEELKGRYADSD